MRIIRFLGCISAAWLACASVSAAEDPLAARDGGLVQVRAVVHLNSDVSSGKLSLEELVEAARAKGMGAVFLTENLRARWEYGVEPFRNVIKRTVERPSLLKYGAEKYAKRIGKIQAARPGMSVIMSAEVSPFYFWTGNPFKERLTLNDWDRQLIVTGLEPADYRRMPTLDNGSFARYGIKSVFLVWPLVLIALGAVSLKKKHPKYYLSDAMCILFIAIGLFFALRNFPFKEVIYDQYHGRAGMGPYQAAIDHVSSKGGMTFWSNPDVRTEQDAGPVMLVSPPAAECMLGTKGYTGFACFHEGYRRTGGPGGVWDEVLKEYCDGKRPSPVWTIGELSYHGDEAGIRKEVDEVQTVFLVPRNTPAEILDAMRKGRMYAVRKSEEYRLQLDAFTVKYKDGMKEASAGDVLESPGPVTVSFTLSWDGGLKDGVIARIIRMGETVKEFEVKTPGKFEFVDTHFEPGKKIYYRLDIRGAYPNMLFSNPVFVEFKA